jgi:hypothetical protein
VPIAYDRCCFGCATEGDDCAPLLNPAELASVFRSIAAVVFATGKQHMHLAVDEAALVVRTYSAWSTRAHAADGAGGRPILRKDGRAKMDVHLA